MLAGFCSIVVIERASARVPPTPLLGGWAGGASTGGGKPLDGFKGLGAGKRQAWTPRRSHGCGLGRSDGSGRGVAVACVGGRPLDACWLKVARVLTFWGFGVFGGFGAFGGFGGFGAFGAF